MITAVFLTATLIAAQEAKPVDYLHKESGFIFSHPADWKYSKLRNAERFLFAVGQNTAVLDVFALSFSGEPEIWQAGQKDVAKQLKRTLDRQWQEEILAVPLLLSRQSWSEDGLDMVATTGIIYAATSRKFIFRLTAPKTVYDDADYVWRSALQTLKTDDGVPPRPFDRTQGPSISESGGSKRTVWKQDGSSGQASKPVKGDRSVAMDVAGKSTLLTFPTPWDTVKTDSGFAFKHSDVTGAVLVEPLSALDSMPAGRQLLKRSAATLGSFAKVLKREEPLPFVTRAGMTATYVYREGTSASGFLLTFDAVGANDASEYWAMHWESSDAKKAKGQLAKVVDLAQRLGIELAP